MRRRPSSPQVHKKTLSRSGGGGAQLVGSPGEAGKIPQLMEYDNNKLIIKGHSLRRPPQGVHSPGTHEEYCIKRLYHTTHVRSFVVIVVNLLLCGALCENAAVAVPTAQRG